MNDIRKRLEPEQDLSEREDATIRTLDPLDLADPSNEEQGRTDAIRSFTARMRRN